jgi:hypothetical protein
MKANSGCLWLTKLFNSWQLNKKVFVAFMAAVKMQKRLCLFFMASVSGEDDLA